MHFGLGSFPFARRYLGNRCFFLFLALLRCFSSGGSPPYVMCWRMDAYSLCMRVSPFGNLRINGYLRLPEAYRSLSRPSSALSAKASTIRSFCLTFISFAYVSFPPGVASPVVSYWFLSALADFRCLFPIFYRLEIEFEMLLVIFSRSTRIAAPQLYHSCYGYRHMH